MYSVVVPARPNEQFLSAALDSIAAQTVMAAAVIVVVNGPDSHNSSASMIVRDHVLHPVLVETSRPSAAHALSLGLTHVQTTYVSFLDADDEWESDKQCGQLTLMDANPDWDAVVGRVANFRTGPDGHRLVEPVRAGRLFSAMTFHTRAFAKAGTPDPAAEHFTWLYRWWSGAQRAGLATGHDDRLVLLRRIHESNGWVKERDAGRRQLLGELRRLSRERESRA